MPYVLRICIDFNGNEKCIFCRSSSVDELNLGKIYKYGNIVIHYFCLLFASRLQQNGADDKGILGFLVADIRKEVNRAYQTVCHYCQRRGASSICCVKGCKIKFHLPCGIENYSFHTFFDQFSSYCFKHRRIQVLPTIHQMPENVLCSICQDEVCPTTSHTTIWASCCKTTWFHRLCVQKMALNAGYFFKCPNCNDHEEFRKEMLECGIYIPDQDAAWELEPNSFGDLNERHNACDADICQSSSGRSFSRSLGHWRIILCNTCGSQGVHKKCGQNNISTKGEWTCPICFTVLKACTGINNEQRFDVLNTRRISQMKDLQNKENIFCRMETKLPQKSTRCKVRSVCWRKKKRPFQESKIARSQARVRKIRGLRTKISTNRRRCRVQSTKKRVRCEIDGITVSIPSSCKCKLKSFNIPVSPMKENINLTADL